MKYIVLNLLSKEAEPSLASEQRFGSCSGVIQSPFLSCFVVNKSINLSPVIGSSADPVASKREEANTRTSDFLEA